MLELPALGALLSGAVLESIVESQLLGKLAEMLRR